MMFEWNRNATKHAVMRFHSERGKIADDTRRPPPHNELARGTLAGGVPKPGDETCRTRFQS